MLVDNKTTFGLAERDIRTISGIFNKYPEVIAVHIFGSRAKGTHKPASDIDLAVMNEGVNDRTMLHIKADFEESTLPYQVDLVNYLSLDHADLREHIDRVGLPFYKRAE